MKSLWILVFLAVSILEAKSVEPESHIRNSRSSDHDSVKKEPGGSMFSKTIVFFFFYGFLLLLAFIGFLVWRLRRSRFRARKNNSAFENICHDMEDNRDAVPESMKNAPINDKLEYLPYKKQYEISTENLEKGTVLGKGNFGVVKKGLLKMADPKTEEEEKMKLVVAIKSAANIYDLEQTSMLAAELRLMCAIGKFPNVLALVGAVTAELRKGRLLIVTEYVDCGDLHKYLRDHRHLFQDHLVADENEPDSYLTPISAKRKTYAFKNEGESPENAINESLQSLTTSDLLSFGLQIANGMQFLASIPLVHRDLALRNVLLKKNKTIRIADFGMARKHENKLYYKTRVSKDAPIPVRWMSPEAVHTMTFTQQSDVWSFGICLYELFTLGGLPYPDIQSDDIYVYIKSGRRCIQPNHCHVELYDLMKLCWHEKPELRPTFTHIVEYFMEHMKKSARHVLDYVEEMLRVEADNQRKLDEWIRTDRPVVKPIEETRQSESIVHEEESLEQVAMMSVDLIEEGEDVVNNEEETQECPADLLQKPINERLKYLKYDEKYEIDRKNLKTYHKLDEGNFGVVHKGRLRKAIGNDVNDPSEWMDVAVKKVKNLYDFEQRKMLEQELNVMCAIGKHPNVLTLVAATTSKEVGTRIILEFVEGKDLRDFLRERKKKNVEITVNGYLIPNSVERRQEMVLTDDFDTVSMFDLLSFAYQIANGMEYLAKVPLVHRDLALRNVLIRKNKIIRIADFGLARRHGENKNYYRPSGENAPHLPYFHVAPECMRNLNEKFSEKSDVWSYGVCLYEIFTLGGELYKGLSHDAIAPWLEAGNRLDIPENCHPDVANLMKLCWNQNPDRRPLFSMCKTEFDTHLRKSETGNKLLNEIIKKLEKESVYQKRMEEWIEKPEDD